MTESTRAEVLVEESHDVPIVHFQVVIPSGTAEDPSGQEGLTRLSARMLRRGTKTRDNRTLEEQIDGLGAELGVDASPAFVRFTGSAIKRSLEPVLSLLGEMLREPAFREEEFALLKRESEATLLELTDSDQSLVSMHFRRTLFRGHPYGRPSLGTRKTLGGINVEHARARYERGFATKPRLIGFSGDITQQEAEQLVAKHLDGGASAPFALGAVLEPTMARGRHLRIIDKPERTQTQIQIGRLGTHPHDPDHTALVVGNAVFGGAFTARLMRAVRSERGWSYGASSRLGLDRVREAWSMWTFPAATDAAACIALQIQLMRDWIDGGIDEQELAFAQSYLVKSHAFSIDTADKRLEQAIEVKLYDLPADYFTAYTQRVAAVTRAEVNDSLRRRLSSDDLALAVVATESEIGEALREAAGATTHETVPFDGDWAEGE